MVRAFFLVIYWLYLNRYKWNTQTLIKSQLILLASIISFSPAKSPNPDTMAKPKASLGISGHKVLHVEWYANNRLPITKKNHALDWSWALKDWRTPKPVRKSRLLFAFFHFILECTNFLVTHVFPLFIFNQNLLLIEV